MQNNPTSPQGKMDSALLARFNQNILSNVPHRDHSDREDSIVNATPLIDITNDLLDCAKTQHGLDLKREQVRVLGKLDSTLFGGSVKVRPMVAIIADAISSGQLRSGQLIFEATSGNFGLALGMLRSLGVEVITLVSRRLQEGVAGELVREGVKTIDLDVDICPAPGLKLDQDGLIIKTVTLNLRQQLELLGLDLPTFDKSKTEVEQLLARQDVIGLAKLLAKIYNGYCPEQYDNLLNVQVHATLTGPEMDQQLREKDEADSLSRYKIVCAFGTGGTSTGIADYVHGKYSKKTVHVVFPLANQDVAGIRTKDKAIGLRFYQPSKYESQHEVDFEAAKRTLRYFVARGYDIGESSALALYACIQMLNYGGGDRFIVILADGIGKYEKSLESLVEGARLEVSLEEAKSNAARYGVVLWTHSAYTPRDEGISLIASSLGCSEDRIKVASVRDVQEFVATESLPDSLRQLIPVNSRALIVCMVGATSLRVAELLTARGIEASSITGGIMGVSGANIKSPAEIVQIARE